jgi:hypothetical protein
MQKEFADATHWMFSDAIGASGAFSIVIDSFRVTFGQTGEHRRGMNVGWCSDLQVAKEAENVLELGIIGGDE